MNFHQVKPLQKFWIQLTYLSLDTQFPIWYQLRWISEKKQYF